MRFVQHPVIRPHRCALLPHLGASNEPTGFFDFNTDLDLEHVYVSFTAFRQMADAAGFVPAGTRGVKESRLARELDDMTARARAAEERLMAAEKQMEAVEVLKAAGFTQARKPGRPKKQSESEKAPA